MKSPRFLLGCTLAALLVTIGCSGDDSEAASSAGSGGAGTGGGGGAGGSAVDSGADRCNDDGDCDDGLFCNGAETCAAGSCRAGSAPCTGTCDEDADACGSCASDSDCDDGLFCNGAEVCSSGSCNAAASAPCAGQSCDETADACQDVNANETISLDSSTTYQTMLGWEATAQAGQGNSDYAGRRDELMKRAANELGLNRIRLELLAGMENPSSSAGRYDAVNDDNDPNNINAAGFHWEHMDTDMEQVVLPLEAALKAKGEELWVSLCYVDFGDKDGTVHSTSAAEYAELVLAATQHLDSKYGRVPDSYEVMLEPDLSTAPAEWDKGSYIGQAIVATNKALSDAGYTDNKFVAPSTTNLGRALPLYNEMKSVAGAIDLVMELSYHRYVGVSTSNLAALGDEARKQGIGGAMLEKLGAGIDELYDDLTIGNNTSWQQYALAFGGPEDDTKYYWYDTSKNGADQVTLTQDGAKLSQYFRYVRRGAVRFEASSSGSTHLPVAFTNTDGSVVVVVKSSAAGTIAIQDLPAGTYGIDYSTDMEKVVALPDQTIGAGQVLSTSIPAAGAITIYGK